MYKKIYRSHKGSTFTPLKIVGTDKNQYLCWCKLTNNPPFCDGSHYSIDWWYIFINTNFQLQNGQI